MSGTEIQLVCIACPVGCRLTVRKTVQDAPGADQRLSVEGNRCPKGEVYGREEVLAPRRTVTAAVLTDSDDYPCVPVRTDRLLAREMVHDLLRELYRSRFPLPVKSGDVLIGDWRGTGVRVVATRTLPPDQVPPVGQPGAEAESDDQIPRMQ